MNGQFVISLDFEKFWGIFDSLASGNYDENIQNVDLVVDRLLDLCNKYDIKLTFATVGFLFNKTKKEYLNNTPELIPTYSNSLHNPYPLINNIGKDHQEDSIHYAYKTLLKIKKDSKHEIGTHTYCHYYCLEKGQTLEQFEADIKMAIKVAKEFGVDIKSIVFPRNQVNSDYLNICKKNGILSYRGHEDHTVYKPRAKKESKKLWFRVIRLTDAYINLTGKHTYDIKSLKSSGEIINIPSSYFFRPFYGKLGFLEPLKINRVINVLTKAAKKGELFHMWFHPHNFGNCIEQNFYNLEKIFKSFTELKDIYGIQSVTMSELAEKLRSN